MKLEEYLSEYISDWIHSQVNFEMNTQTLRSRVQKGLQNILNNQKFDDFTAEDMKKVVCDEISNPPGVVDAGNFILEVYTKKRGDPDSRRYIYIHSKYEEFLKQQGENPHGTY